MPSEQRKKYLKRFVLHLTEAEHSALYLAINKAVGGGTRAHALKRALHKIGAARLQDIESGQVIEE